MFQSRTHTCNELRLENAGEQVRIVGWMENVREVGQNFAFVVVRDFYGTTQVVIETEDMMKVVKSLNKESTIAVEGTVRERASKNPKLPTGDIEVVPTKIEVLGRCRYNELPFEINRSRDADEALRLKYRYALPQAPQQFKQLLMTAGFDRYFQIAPCFRDEDARGDRSPGEFYQLDMEMAFATQDDVFAVLEDVLPPIFAKYGKYDIASEAPFRRISYRDAMETYGSDKPDLRIDLTVQDMTALVAGSEFAPFAAGNTVKAVVVPDCAMARKAIDKLCADVEVQAGSKPYWFKVDEQGSFAGGIAKFLTDKTAEITAVLGLKPGCFVGVTAGKKTAAQKAAGVLRTKLGTAVPGHMDKERYEFCWIVDFPMYEIGEESGELEFCHNPFSMPNGGLEILEKAERGEVDPLDIYAYQYDLVCNGVELSSGAVRNHDPEIMVKAFELVRLGEDDVKAKFPAMYNAFCYGAPPHAGIAPGVDRMVMLLAGEDCIREIIPFPMNKNAQDVMMGAPGTVEPHQLEELHIAVVGDTEPDTEA